MKFIIGFLIVLLVVSGFIVKNIIEDKRLEKQSKNNSSENYTETFLASGEWGSTFTGMESGGQGGSGAFVSQGLGENDE